MKKEYIISKINKDVCVRGITNLKEAKRIAKHLAIELNDEVLFIDCKELDYPLETMGKYDPLGKWEEL